MSVTRLVSTASSRIVGAATGGCDVRLATGASAKDRSMGSGRVVRERD